MLLSGWPNHARCTPRRVSVSRNVTWPQRHHDAPIAPVAQHLALIHIFSKFFHSLVPMFGDSIFFAPTQMVAHPKRFPTGRLSQHHSVVLFHEVCTNMQWSHGARTAPNEETRALHYIRLPSRSVHARTLLIHPTPTCKRLHHPGH